MEGGEKQTGLGLKGEDWGRVMGRVESEGQWGRQGWEWGDGGGGMGRTASQ